MIKTIAPPSARPKVLQSKVNSLATAIENEIFNTHAQVSSHFEYLNYIHPIHTFLYGFSVFEIRVFADKLIGFPAVPAK